MPVVEVTDGDLVQTCAACGAGHRHALASLRAGLAEGTSRQEGAVALPPCAHCGAVEFLFRSPAGEPPHPQPGGAGHLHRLLVDHVHGRLAAAAGGNEADAARARPGPGDAELARWFPGGLRMPTPRAEALRPKGPDDPALAAIAAGTRRG